MAREGGREGGTAEEEGRGGRPGRREVLGRGMYRSHNLDRRDQEERRQGGRRGEQGSCVLYERDNGIKGITLGRSGRGRCRVSLFREVERGQRDQGGSRRGG